MFKDSSSVNPQRTVLPRSFSNSSPLSAPVRLNRDAFFFDHLKLPLLYSFHALSDTSR